MEKSKRNLIRCYLVAVDNARDDLPFRSLSNHDDVDIFSWRQTRYIEAVHYRKRTNQVCLVLLDQFDDLQRHLRHISVDIVALNGAGDETNSVVGNQDEGAWISVSGPRHLGDGSVRGQAGAT
ncbi:unnamed protein product [Linum trigynum]|uniref:Uncharacterized protein n=1 Tax=Linum trigynum TaxID=586398 RepID=A0AAV2EEC3_9ROSI